MCILIICAQTSVLHNYTRDAFKIAEIPKLFIKCTCYFSCFVLRPHINLMVNSQGAGTAQVVYWPDYGLDECFQQISISSRHTPSPLSLLCERCQELFSWG
jgi:hypothetical protein